MSLYHIYDSPNMSRNPCGAREIYISKPQSLEDSFFWLKRTFVLVSIFNTNNHVVNDSYAWTMPELLVGWFASYFSVSMN